MFLHILHQSSRSWDVTSLYFLAKILYFQEPIKEKIWWKFTRAVESLKFCTLMGSLTVSAKKVQKSYLSSHWTVIQNLKKNPLFVWKMTWDISWILTWAVNKQRICTFMGYFCQKYATFDLKWYRRVVSWKITYGFKNGIRNVLDFHTSSWK